MTTPDDLPAPHFSDTVKANGINLFAAQYGNGPHLILVAGLSVSTWVWYRHLHLLSQHFTVTIFDNRGAGKSDTPPGPYTIQQMSEDLIGLMNALAIEKTHLLGISLGGFISQHFAIEYPERVDHLILVATGPGGQVHVPMVPEVMALLLSRNGGQQPGETLKQKLLLAFTDSFLESAEGKKQIHYRLRDPQSREAFEAQAAAGSAFDRCRDLHRIQAPTLVMSASDDQLIPIQNGHYLHQRIPQSQFSVFNGLRHQFFVEDPDRFCKEVIAFLTHD